MKEQIIDILSEKLDKKLVKDLIENYTKIKTDYIHSNFEEAQSKSGKFVENIFRILHYIRTNQVLSEIKSYQITDEVEKLKKADGKKFSESIRIIIPEISNSLIYLTRSKLGSVHVKSVKPEFIDAKLTITACDWIIAELLRTYHERDSETVENLIKNVVQENIPILQKHKDEIFLNVKVKAEKEILIRLFDSNEGLTRKELGKSMKQHYSPGTITQALDKLKKERKIHLTKEGKFIISDSQRGVIGALIEKQNTEIK